MTHYSHNRKRGLYRAVLLLLCAFVLVLTPLFSKTAFASNDYIDDIVFYKNVDGYYHISFYTKTTFTYKVELAYWFTRGYQNDTLKYAFYTCPRPQTFTAGQNYDFELWYNSTCSVHLTDVLDTSYYLLFDTTASFDPAWTDTEKYYFSEMPSLTITYPFDYAEIADAFNITGSYTLPDGSTLNKLEAYFGYDVSGEANYYSFYQDVSAPSGDVEIRVFGLPEGDYLLGFAFINTLDKDDWYMPHIYYNIKIMESIPPELPDGETPPFVFDILEPIVYYTANSNYPTSTLLFDNLSGAIKPLILIIGNNLTFFSSRFEQDKARETGESIASGVLIVRAYANNLNSFFSDLPISQALFLYLLLLVVVAVFRIVKNLINLIKP